MNNYPHGFPKSTAFLLPGGQLEIHEFSLVLFVINLYLFISFFVVVHLQGIKTSKINQKQVPGIGFYITMG